MEEFYKKNKLNFECLKGCIDCCKREGLVYFSPEEIKTTSKFLKISPEEFISKYLFEFDGDFLASEISPESPCPFLEARGCKIQEVKPHQCSSYPLWPEVVESQDNWESEASLCPGINKGNRAFSIAEIERSLKKEKENPV